MPKKWLFNPLPKSTKKTFLNPENWYKSFVKEPVIIRVSRMVVSKGEKELVSNNFTTCTAVIVKSKKAYYMLHLPDYSYHNILRKQLRTKTFELKKEFFDSDFILIRRITTYYTNDDLINEFHINLSNLRLDIRINSPVFNVLYTPSDNEVIIYLNRENRIAIFDGF